MCKQQDNNNQLKKTMLVTFGIIHSIIKSQIEDMSIFTYSPNQYDPELIHY